MKTKLLVLFILFLALSIFTSCSMEKEVPRKFTDAVEEIRLKYAPDKRIALFNVEYNYENNILLINSETNNHDAVEDLRSAAENLLEKDSYDLQVSKLPSAELGDSTYAIVNISVAHLRRAPKHSAELIDQSIMGTELKILKKNGGWFLVQTPYDYLGWTGSSSFVRCTKDVSNQWNNSKKVQIKSNYAQVMSDKKSSAYSLCDAVYGSELKYEKTSGSWFQVSLPDGKVGFIEKKHCNVPNESSVQQPVNINQLLKTAKSFLGIPYLWGGNSTKSLDCSGFTQTVYKSQGMLLPRDANMQVNMGDEIKPDEEFSNVKKGDLVFFGPNEDRITHVGISLGGPVFIHSSGNVHINSFNKDHDNFNKYRFKTLRYIKRIVKE
ncbi:MAG: C40 family peptidase [Calditrichia bacterium]|nr:C40 family peptidase [Calditrichia bacterium]